MKETIWNATKSIAKGTAVITGVIFCAILGIASTIETEDLTTDYGYSDAIKALVHESNMFSSHLDECIAEISRTEDSEYYKAIIDIARSNMFSSAKRNTILNLNKKTV